MLLSSSGSFVFLTATQFYLHLHGYMCTSMYVLLVCDRYEPRMTSFYGGFV